MPNTWETEEERGCQQSVCGLTPIITFLKKMKFTYSKNAEI